MPSYLRFSAGAVHFSSNLGYDVCFVWRQCLGDKVLRECGFHRGVLLVRSMGKPIGIEALQPLRKLPVSQRLIFQPVDLAERGDRKLSFLGIERTV